MQTTSRSLIPSVVLILRGLRAGSCARPVRPESASILFWEAEVHIRVVLWGEIWVARVAPNMFSRVTVNIVFTNHFGVIIIIPPATYIPKTRAKFVPRKGVFSFGTVYVGL